MKIDQNKKLVVFWFRRDLRLNDNTGLFQALTSGFNVLPIFIFDKNLLGKLNNKSDARVCFIKSSLEALNIDLKKYQSSIQVFYDTPIEAFKRITSIYEIKAVFANTDYEPYAIKRDNTISQFLQKKGIEFKLCKDQVIFEKNDIVKADGKPYTIFTPYMKQWKSRFNPTLINPFPSEEYLANIYPGVPSPIPPLSELGFTPSNIPIPSIGKIEPIITNYNKTRDLPVYETTKIGVHLRFGTESIRHAIKFAVQLNETWLNELIWREFFQMIIYHFPYSAEKSFKKVYDKIEWSNNEEHFKAWCEGKTGIPLVDAGMRELNQTGFMHNRVRMVVASFLCKNLLIDWRWGEAYFAEKLLDYELASNVGNWQWAAGSGCDAAPYFRIFNPNLQLDKFDKNREYVKKWIPELSSDKYPKPIIDLKLSALKTLEVYKKALKQV